MHDLGYFVDDELSDGLGSVNETLAPTGDMRFDQVIGLLNGIMATRRELQHRVIELTKIMSHIKTEQDALHESVSNMDANTARLRDNIAHINTYGIYRH